ncbi:MAG TPA: hypothetical protein VLK84_05660 [Longimicrobium sp.]|nr:hypothetical protein [Longimicrobium sp.]
MHVLRRFLALIACAASVAACGGDGGRGEAEKADAAVGARNTPLPDSAFAVDLSTPDRALRTYWHLRSMADTIGQPVDTAAVRFQNWQRADSVLARIYGGDALAEYRRTHKASVRQQYAREILQVEPQSETRATVLARIRNVTPVPPGAALDPFTARRRAEGDVYRYVFERDSAGWKLVQVLTKSYPGDMTWRPYFQPEDRTVPTWTYP